MEFLRKIENLMNLNNSENNYRSTHPFTQNRITWINSALENYNDCNFEMMKNYKRDLNY